MASLRKGSSGQQVLDLQKILLQRGFDPGTLDGAFGGGTEAALMAFQHSEGLLADGIAGPRTLTALGAADPGPLPSVIPGVTVAVVSEMFPRTPISNIKANLPPVLNALAEGKLAEKPMVLMALATIRAETEGFVPISEGRSRYNSSPNGHPFDLYDKRRDIGNQGPPDGASFCGRGFVQLTGRANYAKFGPIVGLGDRLLANPDLANDPVIAAKLLTAFLAAHQLALKRALLADDLAGARRLVNGGSHGLDRFTQAYRTGERLIA